MALAANIPDMDIASAEADFSRPANTTAYASGDLIAQSETAGACSAMQFTLPTARAGNFRIARCRIRKSGTSTTNASFRVHFMTSAPVFTNGDNSAIVMDNPADYLGYIDVVINLAFASDAAGWGGALLNTEPMADLRGGSSVYAVIEARGSYTPESGETFSLLIRGMFDRRGIS